MKDRNQKYSISTTSDVRVYVVPQNEILKDRE